MINDALRELIPPGMPPLLQWRIAMAMAVVLLAAHVMWACGWIPGLQGFAFASDVDEKIQETVEPIKEKLEEMDQKLSRSDAVQKRILIAQLSAQLRDLHSLRCGTTNERYRQRLNSDIEDAQQEFRQLAGERYPLDGCPPEN